MTDVQDPTEEETAPTTTLDTSEPAGDMDESPKKEMNGKDSPAPDRADSRDRSRDRSQRRRSSRSRSLRRSRDRSRSRKRSRSRSRRRSRSQRRSRSRSRSRGRGRRRSRSRGRGGYRSDEDRYSHGGKKVFVGNLDHYTDEVDLEKVFSRYGQIEDIFVPRNQVERCNRGYGFVTFSDKRDAVDACAEDGMELHGRRIGVNLAKPRAGGDGRPPKCYVPSRDGEGGAMRAWLGTSGGRPRRRRSRSRSGRRRHRSRSYDRYSRSRSRSRRRSRSRSR